jgi:hypothetical protein
VGGGKSERNQDYDYGTSSRFEPTGTSKTQRTQYDTQRGDYDTTGTTKTQRSQYDTQQGDYDTTGTYDTTTSTKTQRAAAAGAGAVGLGGVGAGAGVGAGTGGGGLGGSTSRGGETSGAKGEDISGGQYHGKKPSLIDKLNPMKDSNKDGKAGFMS